MPNYLKFDVGGRDKIFIQDATTTSDGLMSAADKAKLNGLAAGTGLVVTWTFGQSWSTIYPLIQAAQAVAASSGGGGCIVLLVGTSSFVSPFQIDTTFSTINFDGVTFIGTPNASVISTIAIAAGVTLGGNHTLQSFYVNWRVAGSLYSGADSFNLNLFRGRFQMTTAAIGFTSTGAGISTVFLADAALTPAGGQPVFSIGDGTQATTLQIRCWGGSNSLAIAGTVKVPNAGTNAVVSITYDINNLTVSSFVTGTQVTLTLSATSTASAGSYTPASSANWNNSNPTSIADALDRLAAKSGPIP